MHDIKFKLFEDLLNISDFRDLCLRRYPDYLEDIINYSYSCDEILLILREYIDVIINRILNTKSLSDLVLTKDDEIRHDIDISSLDFNQSFSAIFKSKLLDGYLGNIEIVMLLETIKLINKYGMDRLMDKEQISKEINAGSLEFNEEEVRKRMYLINTFGNNIITLLKDYPLLKKRIDKLKEVATADEMSELDKICDYFPVIDEFLAKKDKRVIDLLKMVYFEYNKLNRSMLINRINNGDIYLLHFLPNFQNDMDISQRNRFEEFAKDEKQREYKGFISKIVSRRKANKLYESFKRSLDNPFDLSLRVPLKNRYVNSSLKYVITKPTSLMSCALYDDDIKPHLDRTIALGFTDISCDSIKTMNSGYNNELDGYSFEKNEVPFNEILEGNRINELLVNWKIAKPSFVMVLSDDMEIDDETREYISSFTDMPIVVKTRKSSIAL